MGKKSKVPKAPNYTKGVAEQTAANKGAWQENLTANRANQNTAFGSTSWAQDPTTGQWTQNTTLAPEYDAIRQQQAGTSGILAGKQGEMAGGLDTSQIDFGGASGMPGVSDYSKLGAMPGASDYSKLGSAPGVVDYSQLGEMPTVGGYNQQVIDTLRKIQSPELQRARSAKEAQLAAMGMGTGSGQAWNAEQSNIGDRESRADLNAIMAGINQGNTEFGQGMQRYGQGVENLNNQWRQGMAGRQQGVSELDTQFNQGMTGRQQGAREMDTNFTQGMQTHQQGIQDILSQREANLGQLSGLMGLGSQVTNPTFDDYYTSGAYQTGDQMQAQNAAYQAALNKTNAANADRSSNMSALGTIGGIAASF